jgi:hypothetical protein
MAYEELFTDLLRAEREEKQTRAILLSLKATSQKREVAHPSCFGRCQKKQTRVISPLKGPPALRVTPAMEARLADHVWSIEELLRP